jgi:hypothetical protein
LCKSSVLQDAQSFAVMINKGHGDGEPAIQAVRGTGNSGVVGADRHLNPVENPVIHLAFAD